MQLVASRVQIKQTAVSYPGVGRFRRAETGILGRAIKGVPMGLPFLFAHIRALGRLSPAVNLASGPKEPAGHRRYGMARSLKFEAQACREFCLCDT
jgi:hypothetical protein